MDRPALKRLLDDVEAERIDRVVVYEVDRLSRSLLDLARIVEVFETHGVSFVSVTQQSNTATSMGRLILNVLLSFAQFEREMSAERTRDKMHAARRKGKWVGGFPPLGYDVAPNGGRLVVNEAEAEQVREIFRLYLHEESLSVVVRELNSRGWTTKSWVTRKGKRREGRPWAKGSLHRLLRSVVYTGKVAFKGELIEGEHDSIISARQWRRAQEVLEHNGRNGGARVRSKYGALLKDLVHCAACNAPTTHTYTVQGNKRYRYYVCARATERGWARCPSKSLSAGTVEQFVVERTRGIGSDPGLLRDALAAIAEEHGTKTQALGAEATRIKSELHRLRGEERSLIAAAANDELAGSTLAERLGELQERIGRAERRQTEVGEQLIALERSAVSEDDLRQALSLFGPVWEHLFPREQARILRLLIERVEYDGAAGTLQVTVRDTGIKALAEDACTNEQVEEAPGQQRQADHHVQGARRAWHEQPAGRGRGPA